MKDITVAAVNFQATLGDVEANLDKVERWAKRLSQQGAELICFPEMCICGYDRTAAIVPLAQTVPGPAVERLVSIAARHGITLLAGLAEVDSQGRRFISHVVATPRGLAGVYRKTHLSPPEREVFLTGDGLGVFGGDGCTFGVQLCYDTHFPELSTLQALAGAEVLFMAFATPRDDPQSLRERLLCYLPARAYDNGCYAVACNLVGTGRRGQSLAGVALIIGPKGELLADATGWEEGAALARLSGSEIRRLRRTKMGYFVRHRRPELYRSLYERIAARNRT
jgi:N-carbamoylputrescine amidase